MKKTIATLVCIILAAAAIIAALAFAAHKTERPDAKTRERLAESAFNAETNAPAALAALSARTNDITVGSLGGGFPWIHFSSEPEISLEAMARIAERRFRRIARKTGLEKDRAAFSAFAAALIAEGGIADRQASRLRRDQIDSAIFEKDFERSLALLETPGVSPDENAYILTSMFMDFANNGNPDEEQGKCLRRLKTVCDRLYPLCKGDAKSLIHDRLIDLDFFVGDYEGSVRLLREGVSGRSATWVEGSVAKVYALKAGRENNWAEQVRQLEVFGKCLEKQTDEESEEYDPATGAVFSREFMLAKNCIQIAKACEKLSDSARAAAEREKARPLFAKAVEQARKAKDAHTVEVVEKEMKAAFGE